MDELEELRARIDALSATVKKPKAAKDAVFQTKSSGARSRKTLEEAYADVEFDNPPSAIEIPTRKTRTTKATKETAGRREPVVPHEPPKGGALDRSRPTAAAAPETMEERLTRLEAIAPKLVGRIREGNAKIRGSTLSELAAPRFTKDPALHKCNCGHCVINPPKE